MTSLCRARGCAGLIVGDVIGEPILNAAFGKSLSFTCMLLRPNCLGSHGCVVRPDVGSTFIAKLYYDRIAPCHRWIGDVIR